MSQRMLPGTFVVALALLLAAGGGAHASDSPKGTYTATVRDMKVTFVLGDKDKFTLSDSDGKTLVTGTYKVAKDEIEFTDDGGPLKADGTGKYKWKLADKTLTFTKVKDEAAGRGQVLTGTAWTVNK